MDKHRVIMFHRLSDNLEFSSGCQPLCVTLFSGYTSLRLFGWLLLIVLGGTDTGKGNNFAFSPEKKC